MKFVRYITGFDVETQRIDFSMMMFRIALFGYCIFDILLEYKFVYYGYSLFLWTGIVGFIVLVIEAVLSEEQ